MKTIYFKSNDEREVISRHGRDPQPDDLVARGYLQVEYAEFRRCRAHIQRGLLLCKQEMKFKESVYIAWDPFSGSDQDTDIECHTEKLVKVRKVHDCMLAQLVGNEPHEIQPGELARYDHALVDGEWGSYYSCLRCMDKWLIEEVQLVPPEGDEHG